MSEKYKVYNHQALTFVTTGIVHWINLFSKEVYKEIIVDSLKYCTEEKGLIVYAYVIMSNHIHLIIRAKEGFAVNEIIRDFKKFTSKQLTKEIETGVESRKEWLLDKFQHTASQIKRNSKYKVWRDGYHPVELSTNEMIDQRIDYIHNNPVEAGIVFEAEHYKYSSAIQYAGGIDILLPVEMIS